MSSPPLIVIFTISLAALSYEVLLVRMFAITQWHHFGFMVISIALLGYGASGSFVTVFQRYMHKHYANALVFNSVMFSLSAIICFIAVQHLEFNSLEILWDRKQWLRLMLCYLLLTLPFFFASNVIVMSMVVYYRSLPSIYGTDLVGAGVGAITVLVLLEYFPVYEVLRFLCIIGLIATLFALFYSCRKCVADNSVIIAVLMLFLINVPEEWIMLHLSEYKGLEQSLHVKGAQRLARLSDAGSRMDVLESSEIPIRYAPGMSMKSAASPPAQLLVFRDGDEMSVIDHIVSDESIFYRNYMTSALPYYIVDSPHSVLVLNSGTGAELHQAVSHGAFSVDAVENDAKYISLITERYSGFYGWDRISEVVSMHNTLPRGFVLKTGNLYEIVIIEVPGASSGGAAGVNALASSYTWTTNAITAYLNRLAPDGMLSITMWSNSPPRDNLRLFATVVEAMNRAGIANPGNRMAWIRSWNTATLLIKNGMLTVSDKSRIRHFCESRAFDLAWLPDISLNEINRYQKLQRPYYYLAAKNLLADTGTDFIESYKYDIRPVNDDRPYFNDFFKWSSARELVKLPGHSGVSLVGVGYPTLLVTMFQAVMASVILIIVPLLLKKRGESGEVSARYLVIMFFMCIGLAYLFIEIAIIEKFILLLSKPHYAVATTLSAFLVFSGTGSMYVQWKSSHMAGREGMLSLKRVVISICLIAVVYIAFFPVMSKYIIALPEPGRIMAAFIIASPLAFFMGMPLALGMAATRNAAPGLVPWAWGVNGCASVLSAVLAIQLAMLIGFSGVILIAVVLYALALASYGFLCRSGSLNPVADG